MGKGKARKTIKPAAANSKVEPADPSTGMPSAPSMPSASALLDEVHQRCEKLRAWQREAEQSLRARAERVEQREREIAEIAQDVELGRQKLELDRDAVKRARLMLDKERAQLQQSQAAVEAERERVERERESLLEQQKDLDRLRQELDAEWENLERIRHAQAQMAEAMSIERQRIREAMAGKGVEMCVRPDTRADEDPGLSLSKAA